ncbi:unnamed protein product [Dicrocoelium dendriticum]|nr:unnamed protein product [Dicrocoelium dendriticum]
MTEPYSVVDRSLSDDEIRSRLKEFGYDPPPICDEITRTILLKKLARFIDPACTIEQSNWEDHHDWTGESVARQRTSSFPSKAKYASPAATTKRSQLRWALIAISLIALVPLVLYTMFFT